jgi:transcription antitermination factor NusG
METPLSNGNWYALCTKPKTERKVATTLAKMQIETYLPQKKAQRSWSLLKRAEPEALFPSIIFVKASEDRLAEIKRVNGVVNFLYWLNTPAVIQPSDIQLIQTFLEQHNEVRIGNIPVRRANLVSVNSKDTALYNLQQKDYISLASLGFVLIGDVVNEEEHKVKSIIEKSATPLYSYRDAS